MEYRAQEVKAGLMVVVSVVILIGFFVAISGIDLLKSQHLYRVQFKYVGGIEVGSLVRYGGMEVGQITAIQVAPDDPSRIELELKVDDKTPIKADSKAYITSIGILGDFYVEIAPGSANASFLKPGAIIPSKDVPGLMQLMEPISQIADQVNETLVRITELVSKDNQQQIYSILTNLNKLLSDNYNHISIMIVSLKELLDDFNKMGDKIDGMLGENGRMINQSLANLEETLNQSKTLVKNLDKTMTDLDRILISRERSFIEIMENLERTSRNFEEFSRTLKERPWNLVRKSTLKARDIP